MKTMRGFTMIELIVTMAVIAILGALAINSYRGKVIEAHRSDAWSALLQIQAAEERYFLQNGTYTTDLADAPPAGLGIGTTTQSGGFYTLSVAADTGTLATNTIANSYIATATASGTQTSDLAACQTFTVNTLGARTPADSTGCWK